MTAALRPEAAKPCPVCGDDPNTLFSAAPWGFHDPRFVRCPLCVCDEGAVRVWRDVLAPFLEARTA